MSVFPLTEEEDLGAGNGSSAAPNLRFADPNHVLHLRCHASPPGRTRRCGRFLSPLPVMTACCWFLLLSTGQVENRLLCLIAGGCLDAPSPDGDRPVLGMPSARRLPASHLDGLPGETFPAPGEFSPALRTAVCRHSPPPRSKWPWRLRTRTAFIWKARAKSCVSRNFEMSLKLKAFWKR